MNEEMPVEEATRGAQPDVSGEPRRRSFRFAFGLRSLLLVLTVVGIWLAWESHIVRKRERVRAVLRQRGAQLEQQVICTSCAVDPNPPPLPMLRRLFGDRTVAAVMLEAPATPEEIAEIKKAFPEALYVRTWGK